MKKSLKLFSSALAIGMILGTNVSSLSAVAQEASDTTPTSSLTISGIAKKTSVRGVEVVLGANQITLDDNHYISAVEWKDNQKQDLLNGGTLVIPANDSNGNTIKGIASAEYAAAGIFSDYALGGSK
ncbi:hypothetical protein [Secundilactobacillus mixtipabuli]|uniref:WxL domain-containing protein n=1 Tax=Secundilactobacillus mixtipabuli TaxID=1435342 RepID=A0A1Z5I8W8_9LACO|nr:hypothetical protein [Secundilactobacillus mixtipabuli]GAW98216.1 hypothetical protein IWT30_00159 [Secundilactobacillus mixtipabuli]